ncbi:MAG: biotin--[acetyl-CoA-carboxylase] ligase [Chloroflexi bacterium]|nr:biotin--[acetyl-CoA-carboxylase] ligase [Chloroflexota bacterium]
MVGTVATDWHAAARPGARIGAAIEVHEVIGSTNDRVRDLLEATPAEGMVVVAELQSAGRGRRGRSWTSPAGLNLTASVGLRPRVAADAAVGLIPAAALAARAACRGEAEVDLKWPNDLVAPDGRKVGGLLVEVASEADRLRHAVLGFGINVNWAQDELPADLRRTATSLGALSGRSVDRAGLLRRLLEALEVEIASLEAGRSPLPRYRGACRTLGTWVTAETPGGPVVGWAAGIDDRGVLIIETDTGSVAVTSGEVVRVRAGAVT